MEQHFLSLPLHLYLKTSNLFYTNLYLNLKNMKRKKTASVIVRLHTFNPKGKKNAKDCTQM